LQNPIPRREAHQIQKEMRQRSTGSILIPSSLLWQELIQPPEDLQEVIDDIGTLAHTDKLHIKSITVAELEGLATAAEYMLDKDDYKAAEEG
jgi:hypothetical protein